MKGLKLKRKEVKNMLRYLKLSILFVGAFALFMVAATDSFAGGDAAAGKAVYEANCAACHGADGNSPMAAAGMAVPNFAAGDRMDKPFEERFNSVCKGRIPDPPTPPMPAFCEKLSETDVRNAIAYAETLKH
jgi:mono/diheme cytochrome c family protein